MSPAHIVTKTNAMPKPSPWATAKPPRRAGVVEILSLFAIALAGFAGVAGLIQAYSFRELHFAAHPAEQGTAVTVGWRFFGLPVWQRTLPGIVRVEEKDVAWRADFSPSDPKPTPNVDVLTVFTDRAGQRALTLQHTSLLREVGHMQACLAAAQDEPAGLIFRETERWWSPYPINNLIGLGVGLLLGLTIGLLFLVGAISALRARLDTSYVAQRIPRISESCNLNAYESPGCH